MERLVIIHHVPRVHATLGKSSTYYAENDERYAEVQNHIDFCLLRGMYSDLPQLQARASLVEIFVRRADKEGSGPGGNDFLFEDAIAGPGFE